MKTIETITLFIISCVVYIFFHKYIKKEEENLPQSEN